MHNPRAVQWLRQFSNWCDIKKVAKMVHCNWSDNHCNLSDPQLSTNTGLQANTLLPSLSRTHTLYLCEASPPPPVFWELVKQQLVCLTSCWFHFRYMLILNGKILEITGHCVWYLCVHVFVCVDESVWVCVCICSCICAVSYTHLTLPTNHRV